MSLENEHQQIGHFKGDVINFIGLEEIASGVSCEVYRFEGNETQDLGIITIQSGARTPRQRVLSGDKTVEGWVAGKGLLILHKENADHTICYPVGGQFAIDVKVGEEMQWCNTGEEELVIAEVCKPPYEDGRFENIG